MAEVGVLHGGSAALILETCQPKTLYLIDLWKDQPRDAYADYREGYICEKMYEGVLKRFKAEIASGQVVILRGYSTEVADAIQDESLDFAYIDADHSYKGCLADITEYWPKVKDGGIMAGHDYDDIEWSKVDGKAVKRTDWGVVSAVNDFFDDVNLIEHPTKNWWVKK